MKFRTHLVYGVLVLAPLGVVVLVLAKGVEILREISEPLAAALGVESTLFVGLSAVVIALVGLLLICWVVGFLVSTSLGAWSFERFESTVLQGIPGYDIVANVLKGFAGENVSQLQAGLVDLHGSGASVLGFVMEELGDGDVAVFVPLSPTPTIGTVHVVAKERVRLLDSALDVTTSISQWGIGTRRALEGASRT